MDYKKHSIEYRCGNCNGTVFVYPEDIEQKKKFTYVTKLCDKCGYLVSFKIYKRK